MFLSLWRKMSHAQMLCSALRQASTNSSCRLPTSPNPVLYLLPQWQIHWHCRSKWNWANQGMLGRNGNHRLEGSVNQTERHWPRDSSPLEGNKKSLLLMPDSYPTPLPRVSCFISTMCFSHNKSQLKQVSVCLMYFTTSILHSKQILKVAQR